jgi:predicted enzyme related to lactoylglutathione lyase
MNQRKLQLSIIIIGLFMLMLSSCNSHSNKSTQQVNKDIIQKKSNPVVYFEIPVIDIDRATKFYSTVFNFKFDTTIIDNNEMALFPFTQEDSGISGALAMGEIYKPTKDGVLIYFNTDNIDETLRLANANGGQILYPKTDNGIGHVAEFEDTEGNRIALYQSKE